jgi:hypothetical protein
VGGFNLTNLLPILTATAGAAGTPFSSTSQTSGTTSNVGTTQSSSAATTNQQLMQDFANAFTQMMSGSSTSAGTTTPTLSPESAAFMNQLIQKYTTQTAPSLTGYSAGQTQGINANAGLQHQAVNNIMASRGLATSPVAATAEAGVEQNRVNQITNMQEQLPLLQNQLNLQNLGAATQFFNTLPRGQQTAQIGTQQQTGSGTQTGTSTSTGTTQQTGTGTTNTSSAGTSTGTGRQSGSSGGGVGGAAAGLATGIALSTALNNGRLPGFGGGGFGGGGIGTFGSDVGAGGGGFGGDFLSDERLKKGIKNISQDKAIDKIRELRGKTWNWKADGKPGHGFVAQDIENVLPGLVHEPFEDKDIKSVSYHGILPYIVGAIQHLDKRMGAGNKSGVVKGV